MKPPFARLRPDMSRFGIAGMALIAADRLSAAGTVVRVLGPVLGYDGRWMLDLAGHTVTLRACRDFDFVPAPEETT